MKTLKIPLIVHLISSIGLTVWAAVSKLKHSEYSNSLLTFALIVYGILIIRAVLEALSNRIIPRSEKLLWVLLILIGGYIGILLFLLIGKKESYRNSV